MESIFTRISGIVTANINALIDQAENPEVMIRQIIREMEKNIWLAKTPKGPIRRMGLQSVTNAYAIWKFAENIEGAKKFLVDYVSDFQRAYSASEFYNFPCFPKTVPDLKEQIAHDKNANPPNTVANS